MGLLVTQTAAAFTVDSGPQSVTVSPSNTTHTVFTANISTAVNETVDLSATSDRLPLAVTPDTLTESGTHRITVHTSLSPHQPPHTYPATLRVQNQTQTAHVPFNVTVDPAPNWTITPSNISFTVPVNTTDRVGEMTVQNTGNTDLTVDLQVNDTGGQDLSSVLDISQRFQVFPGGTRAIPIGVSTALSQTPGPYNGTLQVKVNGETATNITVAGTVIDDQAPQIAVAANDTQATLPAEISATVADNVQVANVTGTISRLVTETVEVENRTETRTRNQTVETARFEKADADHWIYEFTNTTTPGDYQVTATVTDTSGNTQTERAAFQVEQLDAVRIPTQNPQAPGAKVDTWSETELFTLETDTPVDVTLDAFKYGGPANQTLGNATVQLVLPTGGKDFFEQEGETITVSRRGTYTLRVKGGKKDVYNARFGLTPQIGDAHVTVDPIAVTGVFRSFATPADIRRQWAGADFIACSNKATASILGEEYAWEPSNRVDEARYVCIIPFKAVNIGTQFSNEVVPIPPKVRDREQSIQQKTVQHWRGLAKHRQIYVWVLGFFLVFTNLVWAIVVYLYPRIRIEIW